jgi:hypothetical protein
LANTPSTPAAASWRSRAGSSTVHVFTASPRDRIEASAEVAGKTVTAGDIFLVRDASAELDLPAGDNESLARVSAGTGGRALGPIDHLPADLQFDEPRVVRVDRRADVELWSRPLLVLLALFVLGLEWLLRQRSGYL